jgi:hypothetical protein
VTNRCIRGVDGTVQEWGLRGKLPRNFYMTMDEPDASFVRYI